MGYDIHMETVRLIWIYSGGQLVPFKVDQARTDLLGQPDLDVLADKGDDSVYYTKLRNDVRRNCPVCGSERVILHATDTRKVLDVLQLSDGQKQFVTVYVYFSRYMCRNSACKTTFTAPMNFVWYNTLVSKRLAAYALDCAMHMPMLNASEAVKGTITREGINKLLKRWIAANDEARSRVLPEFLGIHVIGIKGIARTLITDAAHNAVLTILPDTYDETLREYFADKDARLVKKVMTDYHSSFRIIAESMFPDAVKMLYLPDIPDKLKDIAHIQDKDTDIYKLQRSSTADELMNRCSDIDSFDRWVSSLKGDTDSEKMVKADAYYIRAYIGNRRFLGEGYVNLLARFTAQGERTYKCQYPAIRARLLYGRLTEPLSRNKDVTESATPLKAAVEYLENYDKENEGKV